MDEVSKSQELLLFLQKEYIDTGYLYSGSWPYNSLVEKGYNQKAIDELLDKGLIQKRNCEGFTYELSVSKRHQLLSVHSLSSRWLEEAGNGLLENIRAEVRDVSLVESCVHNKELFTVNTLKNQGDDRKPNKMDVSCPFSVGQVIQVEYDLPKHKAYVGYSSLNHLPGGSAVGDFIVTDIVCNLLVNPPENMIELQSLSSEFNQIYPDARTMLLFEDVVLKRLKGSSLDEKIHDAKSLVAKKVSTADYEREER